MQMFPSRISSVSAWTELSLGLGYMFGKCSPCQVFYGHIFILLSAGPLVGSLLYSVGGFGLPFLVTGTLAILFATILLVNNTLRCYLCISEIVIHFFRFLCQRWNGTQRKDRSCLRTRKMNLIGTAAQVKFWELKSLETSPKDPP